MVLTSRVHPGESNASWMMKGFIDYLMGETADAKVCKPDYHTNYLPMMRHELIQCCTNPLCL